MFSFRMSSFSTQLGTWFTSVLRQIIRLHPFRFQHRRAQHRYATSYKSNFTLSYQNAKPRTVLSLHTVLQWNKSHDVNFEVFTVVRIPVAVVWVMTSCSLVGVYQRYEDILCLYLQGSNRGSAFMQKFGIHHITWRHNAVKRNRVLRTRL